MRRPFNSVALCASLLLTNNPANAQSVSLSGSMGNMAVLIINGQPKTLAVGANFQGVKLISLNTQQAIIEINRQRTSLSLGSAPVNLGKEGGDSPSGNTIILSVNTGGHFHANGSINGKTMQFMVDTGATAVAMSQADADRAKINYQSGERVMVNTANGQVASRLVTLDSIRINDVQVYNVQGIVSPAPMPYVLLGNSFLSRFQMRQENDQLTLTKKP